MPWGIAENVKKAVFRYVIQHYLGQYLEETITQEQLDLQFFSGEFSLKDIRLSAECLNSKLAEKQNWPLEFVDGYIKKFHLDVPYRTILSDPCVIEITGLTLVLQPKQRNDFAQSMFESVWNSMTSSLNIAEEYAQLGRSMPYESSESFATIIEKFLDRVKVKFIDTVITIEHVPKKSQNGIGIVLNIESITYKDESFNGSPKNEDTNLAKEETEKFYSSRTTSIEGLSISTLEFPYAERTTEYWRQQVEVDDAEVEEEEEEQDVNDESDSSSETGHENLKECCNRSKVLFGKFTKLIQIIFRLKRTEDINGSKVSIDVNLGTLSMFISPRQMYVLLELFSGLNSQGGGNDKASLNRKFRNKPILDEDYQKIEQDIQNQLILPTTMGNLPPSYGHGWSTAPLDTDDEFLPMDSRHDQDSVKSISSSVNSSCTGCTSKSKRKDPTAEISEFKFNLDSLTVVLLHEDILIESLNDNNLLQSSVGQMQQTVEDFFKNTKHVIFDEKNCDLKLIHQALDNAVNLNHLRLLAVSIHLEGNEKTTVDDISINGSLNAKRIQLNECLYEADSITHINVVYFNTNEANFNLAFNYLQKKSKNLNETIDLQLDLNKCHVEFDITTTDRISALLNRQIICKFNNDGNPMDGNTSSNRKFYLYLNSPLISFKLRFPKPDFRPVYDMNRIPWWNRNVRSDYLVILFSNVVLETALKNDYAIKCDGLCVDYYENENFLPVPIAKCDTDQNTFQCKLNLRITPSNQVSLDPVPVKQQQQQQQQQQQHESVLISSLLENCNKPNGPFSAKKVVHQSDTPHFKSKTGQPEELLIPGEKQEIDQFKTSTIASAKIQLDISLPKISLQFQSKHLYELIYNRINNDLLLWQSNVPKSGRNFSQHTENEETFNLCRNDLNCTTDFNINDSDTDDNESSNYYSTYEKQINQNESYLTININVGHGVMCLLTPVRDTTMNCNVIPEQNGEFFINVDGLNFFMVNGYMGDSNLAFVCLQINNGQLYHCDLLPSNSRNFPLNMNGKPENYLFPTIYRSNDGLLIDCKKRGGNRDLFTLAIKIESDTDLVKNITIAAGLNMCTLRHRMCNEPNSWLTQLIDFFNVQDYPISGYKSKEILTELYLHFWESAIDYRPLYIPYKCILSLGTFRISSHFIPESNASSLRFIAEECALFLSNANAMEKNFPYIEAIHLQNDYVNVIDLGLFEISLKSMDKKNCTNKTYFDLRISNNIINIRTCADSCKALTQLIKYFANDGDLIAPDQAFAHFSNSHYSSPKHFAEQELISVDTVGDVNVLSKDQQEKLSNLISDALEDIDDETIQVQVPRQNQALYSYNGAKVYYFPDEKQQQQSIIEYSPQQFQQVKTDLGSLQQFYHDRFQQENIEDEYCFINEETGYNVPKHGHAEIKWLIDEPISLIEEYFVTSTEKVDPLNTPKNFPIPLMKYTLCEMTIVWRLYGGNDFIVGKTRQEGKCNQLKFGNDNSVAFSANKDDDDNDKVVFKNTDLYKLNPKSWRKIGGINRNHNILMEFQLNKIRFQYDFYPEFSPKASRMVVIVTDFEIRDRLQASQINKFLCQYTSQARPKQSNANMLMIKALNIRPDPKLKRQESSVKVSMLPLRFNIDQEALLFLIAFFNQLCDSNSETDLAGATSSKHNTPVHQPPVMTFADENDQEKIKAQAKKIVDENLLILLEENKTVLNDGESAEIDENSTSSRSNANGDYDQPIYFRKVVFSPDVQILLDYQPKRFDLSHGPIHGLLLGLTQLNYTELTLKRIYYRYGLLGIEKLVTYLLQEWLNDIKKNQLPKLLGGVGPMHSFIQLFQGIRDLFWLPFEQYKKDGRFLRGLHRGANSFTTSTAMAALELTTRLIHLIQITAETAFDMLTPGPSVRINPKTKGQRKRYKQPKDIREGVTNAYKLVKEGIEETADNILQVASHEHEQKGYSGAVGGVIRQIPPTIIKPIIIASEATNNVLDGMRCQLVPDARKEANEKWRSDDIDTNLL